MTYNRIPKTVKVGNFNCSITVGDAEDCYAILNRFNQSIIVSKKITGIDVIKQTLIHELVHAMECNNTEIPFLSEQQVDNIAGGIYSLIKNNKKFIEWVMHDV